ncbi:ABC transporter permease [Trueperella pyogenes]|uniref:ABC transporter permease n=1 Tax=Trueperella pyogenes TaxID=1661 RepID=UPI003251D9BF
MMKRLLKNPNGAIGLGIVGMLLALCALSYVWLPQPILEVHPEESWAPVSSKHWLGADMLGRDILSLMIVGTRVTVAVSLGSTFLAVILGLALAVCIVYVPHPISTVLSRIVDVWVGFPTLIIALMIVTAFGGSTMTSLAAIGLGAVPVVTRTVLPELRRARSADYTILAVASGARLPGLLRWHIVPTVAPTVIVRMTQLMGTACLAEAGLSYLGLGTPLPTPTWGRILAVFQQHIYTHPGALMVPAIAITVVIVGFNILGDGLRDALVVGEQ